jgi:hypothetical protein
VRMVTRVKKRRERARPAEAGFIDLRAFSPRMLR